MRIVVTGCNGCVGRCVVAAALKHGHDVVGIDYTESSTGVSTGDGRFTFLKVDLRDFEATLQALSDCDAVAHLAAYPNPTDYKVACHNSNVVISWNVLRASAELGIKRVAQASSVNVFALVYNLQRRLEYFPLDEEHPCLPDDPYGLSKQIAELQADTIVRRYPALRIASLRLHWNVPSREFVQEHKTDLERASGDLWGYVHQDSGAEAFLLALTAPDGAWIGHETFIIAAPDTAFNIPTMELRERFYKDVPIKPGKDLSGTKSFFDTGKAERVLGWVHKQAS